MSGLYQVIAFVVMAFFGIPGVTIAISGRMFRRSVQEQKKLKTLVSVGLLVPVWTLVALALFYLITAQLSYWFSIVTISATLLVVALGAFTWFFTSAQYKYVKSLASSPQPIQQPTVSEVPAEETRTIT